MSISDNELVTLLLCSDLALKGSELKPYSDAAYSVFALALFKAGKQPSDLFSMASQEINDICIEHAYLFPKSMRKDFGECVPQLIKRHQQIFFELGTLGNEGVKVITRANKEHYPSIIRKKFSAANIPIPSIIYYSGDLALVDSSKTLAIVGSRDLEKDMTAVKFTQDVVKNAVNSGYAISSGGAKGVDSIAQEAAMENFGTCVISVSDSLSKKIQAVDIRHAIVDQRCVYMSLVHPHQRFHGYNAMARNKMIYGSSQYAMVISCDCKTKMVRGKEVIDNNRGGTWVGANECAKKNLSKLIVRTCGENTPRGNRELINTVECLEINEQNLMEDKSFDEIVNSLTPHSAYKEAVQTELLF